MDGVTIVGIRSREPLIVKTNFQTVPNRENVLVTITTLMTLNMKSVSSTQNMPSTRSSWKNNVTLFVTYKI